MLREKNNNDGATLQMIKLRIMGLVVVRFEDLKIFDRSTLYSVVE